MKIELSFNILALFSVAIETSNFKFTSCEIFLNHNSSRVSSSRSSNISISKKTFNQEFEKKKSSTNTHGLTDHSTKSTETSVKSTYQRGMDAPKLHDKNLKTEVDQRNSIKLKGKTNVSKKMSKGKNKKPISIKPKKSKKRGKVFIDSREEMLHEKIIYNTLIKPLESNKSASFIYSEESEGLTSDEIKQAMEGKEDSSVVVIPLKRKKDAYMEFFKWAHAEDKRKLKRKIEKEVFEKHKHKFQTKPSGVIYNSTLFNQTLQGNVSIKMNENFANIISSPKTDKLKDLANKEAKFGQAKGSSVKGQQGKHEAPKKQKNFRVESVEFKYDPSYLYNRKRDEPVKKGKKSKQKKKKKLKISDAIRDDISVDDYSAQETFMLNTKKEAMGRQFYRLFTNKSASDFWDNNTLETTKMLEVLLPLGKHLHESLDKVLPNEGKHFLTNLQIYKTELEKFIALVKQDKAETRKDVVELLEEPYDHITDTQYCEDEVKIMFDWDDQEYKEFKKLLKETRNIWYDLQLFHHCYQYVSDSTESVSGSYNCSDFNSLNITDFY